MRHTGIEVWVIDDDESIRWVLEEALREANMITQGFANAEQFLIAYKRASPDVIVTDIRMEGLTGFDLMDKVKTKDPSLPIIIMTAHSDLENAVLSFKGGAFEYLPKPFDIDHAVNLVSRAANINKDHLISTKNAQDDKLTSKKIIGRAPAMQQVFRTIGRLGKTSLTVLIHGESGTGKELIARSIHESSTQMGMPFVAINMAAINHELLESELFGHEKGAFTGADKIRIGRFEEAQGGTIFLDEIGDMSLELQTRLLRILSENEYSRVGGQKVLKTNARVIAATHQNLWALVKSGKFREDLLHRLNVMAIKVPPLRDRKEDILDLSSHYLEIAANELGISSKQLSSDVEKIFLSHQWTGNVRELLNACYRSTVSAAGREIQMYDLPQEMRIRAAGIDEDEWESLLVEWAKDALEKGNAGEGALLDLAKPQFERALLSAALIFSKGKKLEAAKLLGWSRNTITRKIKELNISESVS
jgi:two-component system, NtrC family, nitrogen regulation response regulator GlnG